MKTFIQNISGAAALELALITPLLAVLTLGLTDTGRAIGQRMQLIDAAQQGILYGQLRNPVGDDVSGVLAAIGPGSPENARSTTVALYCECVVGAQLSCAVTCPENVVMRRYLDVTITENYITLFPYPFIGETVPIRTHAVSRLQ
ncbi:MAG: TadE/TadG family type IV pilus assembly protein [Alphaproteobacteria bacterium]